MEFRKYHNLGLPDVTGYQFLLELQKYVNNQLLESFQTLKNKSREDIARGLISRVEELVEEINKHGFKLYRADYSGSIDYENSEQTYCNKSLSIHFRGFSAQVSWDKW